MNKEQQHSLLMEWFGRIPEHYSLYLLPDDKRGGPAGSRYGVTLESGEVFIFEFDFCGYAIPQEDLVGLIPHDCSTCHWAFMKNEPEDERRLYCPLPPDDSGIDCIGWEISSNATTAARVEYYKQLHEKHYGKACISV